MRSITAAGLFIACVVSGLGLFINTGFSSPWLIPWVAGVLLLIFLVSYDAYLSPTPLQPFPFIVLGIILVNFIMQVTGGARSPLWPVYFIFAVVVAASSPPGRAYASIGIILAVESANLYFHRQDLADRWPLYAGYGLSLACASAAAAHISHRERRQKLRAREEHDGIIAKADAVDPLAGSSGLQSFTRERRLVAAVKAAREREITFNGLIDMIYGFVPARTYALFVNERREDEEAFTLRAVKTDSAGSVVPLGTALDPGSITIIATSAKTRQVVSRPDLLTHSLPLASLGYYRPDVRTISVRSLLVIPIVRKDRTIAVLALDSGEPAAFSEDNEKLITAFAPFFIQVIEKIQLSLDLETKAKHFSALHEISRDLNESLWFGDIMKKVYPRIKQLVPYDFCACVLKTEVDGVPHLQFIALDGYDTALIGETFPLAESAVAAFMHKHWQETGETVFYTADYGDRGRDIGLFPQKALQKPMRTLYANLLVAKGMFVGVFFLASRKPNAFTEYERTSLLDTLMNQVAVAANNALLHQQLENMARTDGLTGLLNHRTFMEMLKVKYRELERAERPFSLLLMDIDKFKSVNDRYGHPVGDVAIKAVAQVLRDTARGTDFVARYGGEEFAVGMVETSSRGAEQMAERVRSAMERTVVTRVAEGELKVTLSIGVASFPEDTRNTAELLAGADMALYHAKRNGRNKVSLYRNAAKEPAENVKS